MSTFCTFFRHDSVIADLTLNVDIADDLHGMSSYFAQVKVHESFPITFFFFFNQQRRHLMNQIFYFGFHVIFSAVAQEQCFP